MRQALRRTGFAGAGWFRGQTAAKRYLAKRYSAKQRLHRREARCGSCLRRRRISCREPERQSGPTDWRRRRRGPRAFGRDSDARGSESIPHQPQPFAGRGCIAWWRGRKGLGLRLAFGPDAESARSKPPLPARGKQRRKQPWTELVEHTKNLPPAEAKAISEPSVSGSPPAVLPVLTRENCPMAKIAPLPYRR